MKKEKARSDTIIFVRDNTGLYINDSSCVMYGKHAGGTGVIFGLEFWRHNAAQQRVTLKSTIICSGANHAEQKGHELRCNGKEEGSKRQVIRTAVAICLTARGIRGMCAATETELKKKGLKRTAERKKLAPTRHQHNSRKNENSDWHENQNFRKHCFLSF